MQYVLYERWIFILKKGRTALCTSILQAGDVGLQVVGSFPLPVSGTGAQLLTEVVLNHTQVV